MPPLRSVYCFFVLCWWHICRCVVRSYHEKGEECADGGELRQHVNGQDGGAEGTQDTRDGRGDVGRLEARVHRLGERGEQAVTRHGKKDAWLAHQRHQLHVGENGTQEHSQNIDNEWGCESFVTGSNGTSYAP